MKKLIFLDIDGVLLPSAIKFQYRKNHKKGISNDTDEFGYPFHQPCVDALNYILDETGAYLIMSSKWRYDFCNEYECMDLPKFTRFVEARGIRGKFIDTTVLCGFGREDEIESTVEAWRKYQEITYCVLDDECKDFTIHLDNKVDIDHKVGLTMENARQAIKILNNKACE